MGLKVNNRFPGANGRVIAVRESGDKAEIVFAAEPKGGAESLWYCFRVAAEGGESPAPAKLTITQQFFGTIEGGAVTDGARPVYQPEGQGWYRAHAGTVHVHADGRADVSWTVPYPAPGMEIAFSFPYGKHELDRLVSKAKGYWKRDHIGLSQGGRFIERLSNDYGQLSRKASGVYIMARQHAGETPSSWVMDGILDRTSREKKMSCMLWAVPFVDVDGVVHGGHGKGVAPADISQAWSVPPARHEARVLQHDIQAWAARCQPCLILDLQSPDATAADGVTMLGPDPDRHPDTHAAIKAWANVFEQALRPEFAATEFCRTTDRPAGCEISDFAHSSLKIAAITIKVPYALCNGAVLTQKSYREIGRAIGKTILARARDIR
ncbi:MAG: hypothetical protein ACI9OU_001216 [Candidatus Promineifilaceae bacterium]|jgi:hypothetical protein